MPLALPSGLIAVPSLGTTVDDVFGSGRVTSFRFDLLSNDEGLLGQLATVQRGGQLTWDAYASIKSGGSITVNDPGNEIDWLNVRVQPWVHVDRVGFGGADPSAVETPLGIFLPAAPVEQWDAYGRKWNIELLDKLSILDQDIVTDASGNPVTYTAASGSNVLDLIRTIITDAGELADAIPIGSKTLSEDIIWEAGTTRLKIINDLLDAANYFSLWTDGQGQYRVEPYVEPANRPVVYEALQPFTNSEDSLMSPEWSRDRDIYSVPNRYVVVSQGSGIDEAFTSVATNVDPTSPFSYPSRGRWITTVETGVEAVSLEDLDAIAKRRLDAATAVTSTISAEHVFLPDLRINSIIRFTNEEAGLDMRCSVVKTEVPFDPDSLCKTELREVASFV